MPDMTEQYNTTLSPYEEARFHAWAHQQHKLGDLADYDLRGLWQQTGGEMGSGQAHGPDAYKKPNHPTFSDESVYHGVDGHLGGHWAQTGAKTWDYFASEENMKMNPDLEDYMKQYEPGVRLEKGIPGEVTLRPRATDTRSLP